MPAKPDVSVIRNAPTLPAPEPGLDTALDLARKADNALREAAEILYAADKVSGTVQTRAAIIALRSARTAVEAMTQAYGRAAARERLTPE